MHVPFWAPDAQQEEWQRRNSGLLYLGCSVLLLVDEPYCSCFGTLLEAWLAFYEASHYEAFVASYAASGAGGGRDAPTGAMRPRWPRSPNAMTSACCRTRP